MRVIRVPASVTEPISFPTIDPDPDLERLCTLLGNVRRSQDLELSALTLTSAVLATRAFGRASGLADNPRATRLADLFLRDLSGVEMVYGDAVFFGFTDDYADIPGLLVDAAIDLEILDEADHRRWNASSYDPSV